MGGDRSPRMFISRNCPGCACAAHRTGHFSSVPDIYLHIYIYACIYHAPYIYIYPRHGEANDDDEVLRKPAAAPNLKKRPSAAIAGEDEEQEAASQFAYVLSAIYTCVYWCCVCAAVFVYCNNCMSIVGCKFTWQRPRPFQIRCAYLQLAWFRRGRWTINVYILSVHPPRPQQVRLAQEPDCQRQH